MNDTYGFINKPLPKDATAEGYSIGGIILDNKLTDEVRHYLKASDYSHPFYKTIIEAVFELHAERKSIDPLLIVQQIKKSGKSVMDDDISRIAQLSAGLPYFSSLMNYIEIIKDKSLLRQMIKLYSQLIEMSLSEEHQAIEVLDFAESAIYALRDSAETKKEEYALASDITERRISEVQLIDKEKGTVGLQTNLIDCDRMTSGKKRTDLIIDAARPSMGKSSLLGDDINGIHDHLPEAVSVIFTCETSKEGFADRLLCQRARASLQGFLNNALTSEEWMRIKFARETLAEHKIIIIDQSGVTPLQMAHHIRRIADKFGRIDFAAGDYVELMGADKEHSEERHRLGAIAKGCKNIAKEFNIPFQLVAQLNRKCESRNPPIPILSDLAESGDLEKHADVVRMIYREAYYKKTDANAGLADIYYRKNRNGATGKVPVSWTGFATTFSNLSYGD